MISAVVLTRNSQLTLPACLKSLRFCNQIIIIDDYSQDKTRLISKKYHANFFSHRLKQNFSRQRNYGLKKTLHSWVLFIDSDEVVPPDLKKEILRNVKTKSDFNFSLKRKDFFLGYPLKYGETSRVTLTRLIRKGTGRWRGRVHEYFESVNPVKTLKTPLTHRQYINLPQFIKKLNYYTSIKSKELFENQKPFYLWQLLILPPAKFIQNYFFRLGLLDGIPGLAIAFSMSLHSLMVRIKLYELYSKQT